MKKTYSKFISLLLAFSLLMTMFGVALADDNSETPKEPASIESGHSYSQAVEAGEAFRVRVTAKKAGDLILAISLSEKCDVSASVSGSGSALADTGDGKTFTCTRPVGFGAKIDVSVKTDKAVTVTLKTEVKEKIQEQPEEKQEEPKQDDPKQEEPKQDAPIHSEAVSDVKEEAPALSETQLEEKPEDKHEENTAEGQADKKTEVEEEKAEEIKEEPVHEQEDTPVALSQEQSEDLDDVQQPKGTDDLILEEVVEEQQLDLNLPDEDKEIEPTSNGEELKEDSKEEQHGPLPEDQQEELPKGIPDEVAADDISSDNEQKPGDAEIVPDEEKDAEIQPESDEPEEDKDSLDPAENPEEKPDTEKEDEIIPESDLLENTDEIMQVKETTPAEEVEQNNETAPAEETKEDPETAPEKNDQPEGEMTDEPAEEEKMPFELPEDRSSSFEVLWDVENPNYGDVAHFVATVEGYEGLNYLIQWQVSQDDVNWEDIEGENGLTMDVVVTRENAEYYWRLVIYVYDAEPAAE